MEFEIHNDVILGISQNVEKNAQCLYNQLNSSQKEIVDIIINMSEHPEEHDTKCIYIDGPGGTGKTFIYKTLYNMFKLRNKQVCNMAFTGIAATLLPNGKKLIKHSICQYQYFLIHRHLLKCNQEKLLTSKKLIYLYEMKLL